MKTDNKTEDVKFFLPKQNLNLRLKTNKTIIAFCSYIFSGSEKFFFDIIMFMLVQIIFTLSLTRLVFAELWITNSISITSRYWHLMDKQCNWFVWIAKIQLSKYSIRLWYSSKRFGVCFAMFPYDSKPSSKLFNLILFVIKSVRYNRDRYNRVWLYLYVNQIVKHAHKYLKINKVL
jgi:hypothetical protein